MLSLFGLWDQQRFGGQAPLGASALSAHQWGKLCPAGFSQVLPCFPVWQHFDLLSVQMVPDQSSDLSRGLDLSLPQYKMDKFKLWSQIPQDCEVLSTLMSILLTFEYFTVQFPFNSSSFLACIIFCCYLSPFLTRLPFVTNAREHGEINTFWRWHGWHSKEKKDNNRYSSWIKSGVLELLPDGGKESAENIANGSSYVTHRRNSFPVSQRRKQRCWVSLPLLPNAGVGTVTSCCHPRWCHSEENCGKNTGNGSFVSSSSAWLWTSSRHWNTSMRITWIFQYV